MDKKTEITFIPKRMMIRFLFFNNFCFNLLARLILVGAC